MLSGPSQDNSSDTTILYQQQTDSVEENKVLVKLAIE